MNTIKMKLVLLALLALLTAQIPAQVLSVPLVEQEKDQWCWAGSSQCVFKYYCDNEIRQCDIADYARLHATWLVNGGNPFGTEPCCANSGSCNYWNYLYSYAGAIDDILLNASPVISISVVTVNAIMTREEIQTMLADDRIAIIRIDNGGHFIVLHGYDNATDRLYLMDPWFGEGYNIVAYGTQIYSGRNWTHSQTVITPWYSCNDGVCNPPANLAAKNVTHEKAVLSYSGDSEATIYNIIYRPTGSADWNSITSTAISTTITGLTPETEYEFQVQADCGFELTPFSASALFTTKPPPVCEIPSNLTAQTITFQTANLSWTGDPDPEEANGYEVQYRQAGAADWTSLTTSRNSIFLYGLAPQTSYEFRARTLCYFGDSTFSAIATFTTEEENTNYITAESEANDTWATADGPAGDMTGATGAVDKRTYDWFYFDIKLTGIISVNLNWTSSNTNRHWYLYHQQNMNTYVANGSGPGTYNANLPGRYFLALYYDVYYTKEPAGYNLTVDYPGSAVCNIPGDLTAGGITYDTATLTWDAIAAATGYHLRYREEGTSVWTVQNSTATAITLHNLAADTGYESQIEAVCSFGYSGYSASAFFTTSAAPVCAIPSGLTASNITPTGATLVWDSIADAEQYNIRYRVSGSSNWTQTTSSTSSKEVAGLTASTQYEFQVETVCAWGNSGYSSSALFATAAEPVCGIPSGLTASNITRTSATLSWNAVTGATGYNIRYRVTGSSNWTQTTSSTSAKEVAGLTASTQYEFQVETVCSYGNSGYSTAAGFTTLSQGTGTTMESEPNDTAAQADGPLGSGTALSGSVTKRTNDWFYFELTGAGTISINLAHGSTTVKWYLYHESNISTHVASGQNTGGYSAPAPGRYYLKVYNAGYWPAETAYTLTVTFQ